MKAKPTSEKARKFLREQSARTTRSPGDPGFDAANSRATPGVTPTPKAPVKSTAKATNPPEKAKE